MQTHRSRNRSTAFPSPRGMIWVEGYSEEYCHGWILTYCTQAHLHKAVKKRMEYLGLILQGVLLGFEGAEPVPLPN